MKITFEMICLYIAATWRSDHAVREIADYQTQFGSHPQDITTVAAHFSTKPITFVYKVDEQAKKISAQINSDTMKQCLDEYMSYGVNPFESTF